MLGVLAAGGLLRLFLGQPAREERLLLGGQPRGALRAVVEIPQHQQADDHRRNPFEEIEPLPVPQPADAAHAVHDQARDRSADHAGEGNGGHEERHHARAVDPRVPEGEIENDAGEEPGFGDAEQEAQHVERRLAAREHHRRRDESPEHHDARDPHARTDALQQQVARHFEEEVADEEHARADPVGGVRQAEVGLHLQPREPDVDAIQVGEDVAQEQERQQPPRHRAVGAGFEVAVVSHAGLEPERRSRRPRPGSRATRGRRADRRDRRRE